MHCRIVACLRLLNGSKQTVPRATLLVDLRSTLPACLADCVRLLDESEYYCLPDLTALVQAAIGPNTPYTPVCRARASRMLVDRLRCLVSWSLSTMAF
jgi:hypothetical protein